MLVLTRKTGQRIHIGQNIVITIVRLNGAQVRLGIEAPKEVPVYRSEIADLGWRHDPNGSEHNGRTAVASSASLPVAAD